MTSTWPMREFCVGDPMGPIFHMYMLPVCVGGNANFSVRVGGNANFSVRAEGNANFWVFKYQHVGMPNAKLSRWGYCPTRWPNGSIFASQWNIAITFVPFIRSASDLKHFLGCHLNIIHIGYEFCF